MRASQREWVERNRELINQRERERRAAAKAANPKPDGRVGPVEKFWARVDVRGEDECWPWLAAQSGPNRHAGRGYGSFAVRKGLTMGAHRFSALLHYGPYHRHTVVMHTCDFPPCVNPRHLRLGDRQQNMDDMKAKGRARSHPGEECWSAKLTNAQAAEIRQRYVRGYAGRGGNSKELAEEFGVSVETVQRIGNGRSYRQ
jgi:hypothetical protein